MKLLKVTFVLSIAALAAGAYALAAPTIYVKNESKVITQDGFNATVHAIQIQLDTELEPVWGVTAHLVARDPPTENDWVVTVYDGVMPYLGYHGFLVNPFAKVWLDDPMLYNWQTTLDHEILEMIVDPWTDRLLKSDHLWLVEIADPVESKSFGKWVIEDGYPVLLSDFVTPCWYSANCETYDVYGHVSNPGQVLKNGYAVWWDTETQFWHFIYGAGKVDK